jgi:N6-L-threonylcarbamoyladenine synthase
VPRYILGIESSCDDTAAAVLCDGKVLSNVIASQSIHEAYGGVVPELASRAHQQNIVPVVQQAIAQANIDKNQLNAVAFTQGPGLMGSLLVGASFAKSLALSLSIPLIAVNHMQAHLLAHFIDDPNQTTPSFPFIGVTLSGGHTQIVKVSDYFDMKIIGETLDDAIGEAFDKSGKMLGLPYPAGPIIDRNAKLGNKSAFVFSKPKVKDLDFSFSGLKTGILYFLQKQVQQNSDFITKNMDDLCASIQQTIVEILMDKIQLAVKQTGIHEIAIGGGVSANSGIRNALLKAGKQHRWKIYLPKFEYTTDNAAMIGIVGDLLYQQQQFSSLDASVLARTSF